MSIFLFVLFLAGLLACGYFVFLCLERIKYLSKQVTDIKKKILSLNHDLDELDTVRIQLKQNVVAIGDCCSSCKNKMSELELRLKNIQQISKDAPKPDSILETKRVQANTDNNPNNKNTKGVFYAKAYDMGDVMVMKVLPDDMQNNAPFVLSVNGNDGTIAFNHKSLARNLENIEVKVIAFCDSDFQTSDVIRGIETTNPGKAIFSGNEWKIVQKPKIKVF